MLTELTQEQILNVKGRGFLRNRVTQLFWGRIVALGTVFTAKNFALAVMHDLALALASFERILVLSGGRLISDGTPEEAIGSRAIERAFGVICEKTEKGYVIKNSEGKC